jgi:hypothetical protein
MSGFAPEISDVEPLDDDLVAAQSARRENDLILHVAHGHNVFTAGPICR